MRTCWARVLGDCEGVLSEEHYLSASIIGSGDVAVSGLPFLRGETRTIPAERLTRNMLCEGHNRRLSPVDAAAGQLFEVIKTFRHRAFLRANGRRKTRKVDTYQVDGALIERWALKTIVNVMFDRPLSDATRWNPSDLWVRCAFALDSFPTGCGFYLGTGEFDWELREYATIGIRLLTRDSDDRDLVGGLYRIEDVEFALMMQPLADSYRPSYRIKRIIEGSNVRKHQVLNFDWTNLSSA